MSIAQFAGDGQDSMATQRDRPRFHRDFSQEHRLTSRSLPEICEKVKRVVARLGSSRRVQFRGRKLTNEAFINAAALYLCELDRDSQEMILDAYVTRIETMMQSHPFDDVTLPD